MRGPRELVTVVIVFRPPRTHCRSCGEPFSYANVYSEAGWIETRISGLCEVCFDTMADFIARDDDGGHDDQECDGGPRGRTGSLG